MEGSFGKSYIHFKIFLEPRCQAETGNRKQKHLLGCLFKKERTHGHGPSTATMFEMPPHHAMMYNGRIHQLQQYSGPHRGFDQVAYESESDSSKSDMTGQSASQNN
jgi:hypothetical protein